MAEPTQPNAIITLELSSIKELPSAQQRMYELAVTRVYIDHENEDTTQSATNEASKSVSFPVEATLPKSEGLGTATSVLINISKALKVSNGKLIIREWKHGACWWNCNTNNFDLMSSTRGSRQNMFNRKDARNVILQMARAEIEGYRLASLALSECRENKTPHVAQVLYFSHDDGHPVPLRFNGSSAANCLESHDFVDPWAILSYFDGTSTQSQDKICNHFPTTMIKTRHEFGFDEPHPRHGRVPIDECLDYAMMILRDVVFPLQKYFFFSFWQTDNNNYLRENLGSIACVRLRQDEEMSELDQKPRSFEYLDMISIYDHVLDTLSNTPTICNADDEKTILMLQMLKKCVATLRDEWNQSSNTAHLPPVLCHMDLQPQNLAFRHNESSETPSCSSGHETKKCQVAAVMDWEEACYADPRFEFILICRKVLANRDQADKLWQFYSKQVKVWEKELTSRQEKPMSWDVGPIEPWLKLECVHSLCTLVIQLLYSDCGGRSPWESKMDLLGKINRERKRLVVMGWFFCDLKL